MVAVALRKVGLRRLQGEATNRRREGQGLDGSSRARVGRLAKNPMGSPGPHLEHEIVGRGRVEEVLVAVRSEARQPTAGDGVGRTPVLAVVLRLHQHSLARHAVTHHGLQREDVGLCSAPGPRVGRNPSARLRYARNEGVAVPRGRTIALTHTKAQTGQPRGAGGQILGRFARVDLDRVVADHVGGHAVQAGERVVAHETDLDPSRCGECDHPVQGGEIPFSIGRGRANVRKGRRAREVQQRVREDG